MFKRIEKTRPEQQIISSIIPSPLCPFLAWLAQDSSLKIVIVLACFSAGLAGLYIIPHLKNLKDKLEKAASGRLFSNIAREACRVAAPLCLLYYLTALTYKSLYIWTLHNAYT